MFARENKPLLLALNIEIITGSSYDNYNLWTCQDLIESISFFLLDGIYIRFGTSIYKQKVGISMGTKCEFLFSKCFKSATFRLLKRNQPF